MHFITCKRCFKIIQNPGREKWKYTTIRFLNYMGQNTISFEG